MPRKRKLPTKTSTATNEPSEEPPQKQQQLEQQQEEQQRQDDKTAEERQEQREAEIDLEQPQHEEENGNNAEEEEEYEEAEEVEEAEEEHDEDDVNANAQSGDKGDEDDDPVEKLLEPFNKDQLIAVLKEVADMHSDIAERVRKLADEDPVHRKLFVHGLGWDTTAENLTNEFKKYGEVEDVKNVVDKTTGKCKGYAFVLFKSRKGAREALKEPQKRICNQVASCQLAVVGPAAPQQQQQQQQQQNTGIQQGVAESEYTRRKIYVSNVGADLDPQRLLDFFRKYGEIEDGPLGLDKATGKPKGFCLFVYKTVESAKRALEEPHKNFEGHILHCQKAIDGPKPGKGKFQQQQQNVPTSQFQKKKNPGFAGGSGTVQGHLMAPSAPAMGYQGAAAAQALNPALGQALTALLSNPAAGLGLTNLLGTLGSGGVGVNPGVPGTGPPMQGGYGNQGMHGGYGNQPMGQGGAGRGQHGVGQYGGSGPNMGH